MRRIVSLVSVALLAALGLSACEIGPHHDFVVTVATNFGDADPGDGVCASTEPGGGCSLRAAIDEAGALAADAVGPAPTFTVTLEVDPVVDGAIVVDLGAASLTIAGGSHQLDATQQDRAILLRTGSLTIDRLFVSNGFGGTDGLGGGAIRTEPSTNLVVQRSYFTSNFSGSGSSCLVDANDACVSIDVLGGGGAIFAAGTLVVSQSTFGGHLAAPIAWQCTPVGDLRRCPATWGGAILAKADLLVTSSTFSSNDALGYGDGGAIYATGPSTVVASTFVDDTPGGDRAVVATTVRSSILTGIECGNVAVDADHNLVQQGPCVPGSSGIGYLDDNGGPWGTALPAAGSLAVDAYPPGPAGTCEGLPVDQRDQPRPAGAGCDIGAVERQPTDS